MTDIARLRQQIATMPTRTEWLGGQRTKYVQLATVLDMFDVAAPPVLLDPDACAKTGHGTVRCDRCGQAWVDRVTLLPGSPLEKRHGQAC